LRTVLKFVLIVAVVAGAFYIYQRVKPARETAVTTPELREVVEVVVASGKLRARRRSELGAEVAGVVESVSVEEGAQVTTGQVVVRLRDEEARLRLAQSASALDTARANLAKVEAGPQPEEIKRAEADVVREEAMLLQREQDLDRLQKLFEKNIVNTADYQKARNERDVAHAAVDAAQRGVDLLKAQPRAVDLELARARVAESQAALAAEREQLDKRTVRSALAGVVTTRNAEPGQAVSVGTRLLAIDDMSDPEVLVETDENNLAKLRVDQPATMVAPAFRDQPITGTLRQIGPEVDYERGVVALRLTPGPLPEFARPNMTLDTSIEVGRFADAVSVPVSAVVRRDNGEFVVVVENERARLRKVTVLGRSPEYAALENLDAPAVVLRAASVEEGERVKAVSGEQAAEAEASARAAATPVEPSSAADRRP
jgi:multidrug efflux pump subunit AcrA (membrane-fusion protein)